MRKKLVISILIISIFTCTFLYIAQGVKADSGFDSSYDSGGSSSSRDSSSHDYDSSSSYSDYDSSSSYSDYDSSSSYSNYNSHSNSSYYNNSDVENKKTFTIFDILIGFAGLVYLISQPIGFVILLFTTRNKSIRRPSFKNNIKSTSVIKNNKGVELSDIFLKLFISFLVISVILTFVEFLSIKLNIEILVQLLDKIIVPFILIGTCFVLIFVIIIIVEALKPIRLTLNHELEVNDEKIKEYIKSFDKAQFLKERFEEYKKIQEDWMNFNYERLRENLTDELYNQYEMQLDTLKTKNQKNIMKDIRYIDSMITDIKEENDKITVKVELLVSQIDYIEQNRKPIRGNKNKAMTVCYILTFVLTNKQLDNCPNCGFTLKNSSSNKCEYCGSTVPQISDKVVLSKKEVITQR